MPPSLANAFAALELEEEVTAAAKSRSGGGNGGGGAKKSKKKKKKSGGGGGNGTTAEGDAAAAGDEADDADDDVAAAEQPAAASDEAAEPLEEPLVWIDLEMTGLEVDTCAIIEIACIVTDGNLERMLEGPDLVIHQSEAVIAGMNAWCVEQHGKSGLTERVRASGTSLAAAEEAVLAFVAKHAGQGAPIAGNSVHADLAFIKRYMPRLAAALHYRIVDVSSVRELAKRWYPRELRRAPRKACEHTAMADIRESIAELRWLRRTIFKPPNK